MSEIDEHLERQINRALDGALDEDERLELDRELIRNPEARRLLERCEQLDALAGGVLHTLFSDRPNAVLGSGEMARTPRRMGYPRAWWLLPGAVAAAVLAVFLVYAPPGPEGANVSATGNTGRIADRPAQVQVQTPPGVVPWTWTAVPNGGMIPVNHRPARVDRAIDRGIYGVRGSDGSIYLIEVNRTHVRERPGSQSLIRPVGGDL